jgi:hypothetical protein
MILLLEHVVLIRFIHLSGLNHTSHCRPHANRPILHNLGLGRLQICPSCWAVGNRNVGSCGGSCQAHTPSRPPSYPQSHSPWGFRASLAPEGSPWSAGGYVARHDPRLYTNRIDPQALLHCLRSRQKATLLHVWCLSTPCRYRGSGFDPSCRLLAACMLARGA